MTRLHFGGSGVSGHLGKRIDGYRLLKVLTQRKRGATDRPDLRGTAQSSTLPETDILTSEKHEILVRLERLKADAESQDRVPL